jgi:hypothetical protein
MAGITPEQFQALLAQTRDSFLAKMQEKGFWYLSNLRHDPFPWDINNGLCEEFATIIWERFDRCSIEILSNEDLSEEEYTHTFMKHGNLFFDAEAPNGVDDWRNLPFFKRERKDSARKNKTHVLQFA